MTPMSDSEDPQTSDLINIGEPGASHDIGVYGAPRPAVPERLPLSSRTKGCASGAGSLGSVEPGEFRRLPPWLKIQLPGSGEYAETRALLKRNRLATVCEEARCPNLGHCWARGTATIMILGELCTRRCGFCAVAPGRPNGHVDWDEPRRVGEAVAAMNLRHTVITSVARDDLKDGGSTIFAGVIHHNIETVERLHPVVRPSARYERSLELLKRVADSGTGIKAKSGIMVGLGE